MQHASIAIVIGRNIRHRRLLAGLSQKAVADHLGVTFQQVQKYEGGACRVSCDKLVALAYLLGCSVDDLFGGCTGPAHHNPVHPWNPYKVQAMLSHFNRVRSHAVRDKVCALVQALADLEPSDVDTTM